MPIYKGNTQIVGLYKGNTEIVKRYKGSDLIYEAFSWLPYSYEYLYYSLIPATIDNKSVKDKLRLNKIYANGVIENQLVDMFDTTAMTPYQMSVSVSNNILTATTTGIVNPLINFDTFKSIIGHKYFCFLELKKPYATKVYITGGASLYLDQTPVANTWTFLSAFYTATNQVNAFVFYPFIRDTSSGLQVGDSCDIKNLNVIDLTLMFGTGNEPTTLDDNRIKALLNRGYIPYNTGEYKSTDINEFVSESYNLFDEELERGNINSTSGQSIAGYQVRSKNYIPVIGNGSYTFEYNRSGITSGSSYFYLYEYDKDKNYLGETLTGVSSATKNFTTLSNTRYIRFKIYNSTDFSDFSPTQDILQCCIHRTGTRTGYTPHKTLSPLPFKYQGNGAINSHDTLEITNTEWIFTKNAIIDDISNFAFTYQSANTRWYSNSIQTIVNKPTSNDNKANVLSSKYTIKSFTTANSSLEGLAIATSGTLFVYTSDSANSPTGTITYQLATPQVIRIPRKHLAVVDLGTLNILYQSQYGRFLLYPQNIKAVSSNSEVANIYCERFMTVNWNNKGIGNIALYQDQFVAIYTNDYTNLDDFKKWISGTLLFYETQDEVADIDTTMQVEVGGTITSDSNVLPNLDALVKCK